MENFIFGCISGMCGVLISHPFDTMKTCIQTNNVIRYDIRSLYKGLQYPFIGVGIEKAIVFGTYTNMHKFNYSNNKYINIIVPGAFAGLAASLIVTPVERLKILWQIHDKNVTHNWKKLLTRRSLFQGLSATFTRETPGFAIYFTFFEWFKKQVYNNDITNFGAFIGGGISGLLAWTFIYPQDCIKSTMQSNETQKVSFSKALNIVYSNGGLKNFYRGFHYAIMRAIPLHAGTFCCFNMLTKKFHNDVIEHIDII